MGRVSEYDDREPAEPDHADATGPEPSTPAPGEPSAQQPDDAPAPSDVEDTRPIGWSQPDPYAWPTTPYPTYGAHPQHAAQRPAGAVPGWLWPTVAALALMVGLLGGTLGGVAVSRSLDDGSVDVPAFDPERAALPPLEADNGSIAAVAAELLPSTVQVLARGGSDGEAGGGSTGSGFVLDDQGHVITNNHVVAQATGDGEIRVVDNDGRSHAASIVGRSPVYDIAVLDVEDAEDLRPAALGSTGAMRVGESVVAIGSPLGLSSTVTSGIVSALDRPVTTGSNGADDESSFINAVQTDAAINPGNSGGPLVNMRGEVVGVNSAIATTGGGVLGGESGNIGVGFAIPMEQVRVTAQQILSTGSAKYPVIGASVDTRPAQNGAEVVRVPAGTPASRAGLQEGDVVIALDGKKVADGIGLIVAIRSHQPGDEVTLTVRRDGSEEQLEIVLDAKVG
jgi:putative serine protease PepD